MDLDEVIQIFSIYICNKNLKFDWYNLKFGIILLLVSTCIWKIIILLILKTTLKHY